MPPPPRDDARVPVSVAHNRLPPAASTIKQLSLSLSAKLMTVREARSWSKKNSFPLRQHELAAGKRNQCHACWRRCCRRRSSARTKAGRLRLRNRTAKRAREWKRQRQRGRQINKPQWSGGNKSGVANKCGDRATVKEEVNEPIGCHCSQLNVWHSMFSAKR